MSAPRLWQTTTGHSRAGTGDTLVAAIPRSRTDLDYDDQPLVAGQSYFRIRLVGVFLTRSRDWFNGWVPAVHGAVRLRSGDRPALYFNRMARAPAAAQAQGAPLDEMISQLIPYNGGEVGVAAALLALSGSGDLRLAVNLLAGFSSPAAPPLGRQPAASADDLAGGIETLVDEAHGEVHLAFHQTYTAAPRGGAGGPRPGYVAIVRAGDRTISPEHLAVRADRLVLAGQPLAGVDHLLLRIEGRAERDDWRLAAIVEPLAQAKAAMARPGDTRATTMLNQAILAAYDSPELAEADRLRVIDAITADFEQARQGRYGASGGVQETDLDAIIQTGMSREESLLRGKPDVEQLFVEPWPQSLAAEPLTAESAAYGQQAAIPAPAAADAPAAVPAAAAPAAVAGAAAAAAAPAAAAPAAVAGAAPCAAATFPFATAAPAAVPAAAPAAADDALRPPPAEPPTRTAYGLLDCPDSVVMGATFALVVGLSRAPAAGVAGPPIEMPDRAFRLAIQIVAPGFTPLAGESLRQTLEVTAEAPHPSCTVHLAAERGERARALREIHASYTVEGQPLGFAVRYVTVVRDAAVAPLESPRPAAGVNFPVPTAQRAADLTVIIRHKPGLPSTLLWTFESRHPLRLPEVADETDVGASPQDYALRMMNQVNQKQGAPFELLKGYGDEIGQLLPQSFWSLLGQVQKLSPCPSLLILSEDPFIPWELALLEEPFDEQAAPFLGAQVIVGRWIQPMKNQTRPAVPPPDQVEVRAAAVVSGVYETAGRLMAAEAEAAEILADLGRDLGDRARPVAAVHDEILKCLGGEPTADLLHFSLHGSFDASGIEDGLLLVDGNYLYPNQVRGTRLGRRRPFVFLNACQVGQGNLLLGHYAGMAGAFLFAGAAAVIAPLWSIDDEVAHAIATSFYRETLRGATAVPAAEVLRRERAKFVSQGRSATFVAYQFFGHPEMTLTLVPASPAAPANP
jgi:hypothetical protein